MMTAPLITMEEATSILAFWFEELNPSQWFVADDALDNLVRSRFITAHKAASEGELWPWRATPHGRLAEIIVLDQFSRNIFRSSAQAFSCDVVALVLAQEALSVEADKALAPEEKAFLYMPFMHSESLDVHEVAMELFSQPGLETQLDFEKRHRDIIKRFGRYPHRNAVLGRQSTEEETKFLGEPGSHF